MAGIYIHIPFCKQACSYCDFYFLTRGELKEPFVEALIQEIKSYSGHPFSDQEINTIYFGGGTPSQLTISQLQKIFQALDQIFNLNTVEVTLEMNPDDVSADYLNGLQDVGVNRASMGIQSFDEDLLRFMHRAHTSEEAVKALELLQKTGFPAFTADLIYGNPGQSVETLRSDVEKLLKYSPPHVSAYSLTIEPGTRLGKQTKLGRLKETDEDTVSLHFDIVTEMLAEAGIEQYEVSNYAKPGKEAVHNSSYWEHENYLGLGPSAHSLFWRDDGMAERWNNRRDLKFYLEQDWDQVKEEKEVLDLNALAEERLMLGMRTRKGVSIQSLVDKYEYQLSKKQNEWLLSQQERGYVLMDDENITLTHEGLKIADYLVLELITK